MILDYMEEKKIENESGRDQRGHRMAVVEEVSGGRMRLRFDGEEAASGKFYRGIAVCQAGDRVLCALVDETYVVLGALL